MGYRLVVLPTTILITGAPGSGKSQLGRTLSAELRVPFLARDDVRGGLAFTAGAWTDRIDEIPTAADATSTFLDTVEGLSRTGVSCVVEYVVRKGKPEEFERLRQASNCRVIITATHRWLERYRERNDSDRFVSNPAVLRHLGFATPQEHTAATIPRMIDLVAEMETDFSVPTLRVETTDGWDPSLEDIVRFTSCRVQPPRRRYAARAWW